MLKNKNIKAIGTGAVICLFVSILTGFALILTNPLERMQLQMSSWLYYEHKSEHPIVIVGIDKNTTAALGRQAEWSRDIYATAIKNISNYNPAVIGLDTFFISNSKAVPSEKLKNALEKVDKDEAIAEIKKIVGENINEFDHSLSVQIKENSKLITAYPPNQKFSEKDLLADNYNPQLINPLFAPDDFYRSAFLQNLPENDGSVRKYIPVLNFRKNYPAFAIAIIAKYLGAGNVEFISRDEKDLHFKIAEQTWLIPLENFQMLINFNSKSLLGRTDNNKNSNYLFVPFVYAFNNQLEEVLSKASLENSIVLIGPYVEDNDNYKVPIDNDYRMPGVMIHAQAIQTILDRDWLVNQSVSAQIFTMILLVLLAVMMIFMLRMVWALPALAALILVYSFLFAPLMFRQAGVIVNLIYPPLIIVFTAIIGYAYRYLTEFRQKTKVAGALTQYVNQEVTESVLEGSAGEVSTGGEKKNITVVFTDIRNFTTLSESLKPQSLVALLNEYFEVMAGVITANGGLIDKYVGDAIMAFFEDKADLPGHQRRAAQAALEMRAALPGLLERWKNDPVLPGGEKKPEVDFRVGISSGDAVLGNIGSSQHIQYTAIGDIVNLGSRLESANKMYDTHIMLSETTFEAIKESYECRFLDVIRVKGKNLPVKVYQLICPHGQLLAEQIELLQVYNKALQLYFDRHFSEALDVLKKELLSRWPDDHLAAIYQERCLDKIKNPPAEDWDFVYDMKTK